MEKTFNSNMIQQENYFTSKSNVLKFLNSKLKKSKIKKIFDFTVNQWEIDKNKILSDIQKQFTNEILIIRSSAVGEDSVENSNAGNYESIQKIPSNSKLKIRNAINSVIRSYQEKSNFNKNNQILVQKQAIDIITSGVIFTKTPDLGAPYYVINYEDGQSTIGVTKGTINNTCKLFRKTPTSDIPSKWKKLIESIKEIEIKIGSNILDIEFGITKKNSIIIFQVRPITSLSDDFSPKLDNSILKLIIKEKEKFLFLNKKKHVSGNYTIFSDMSDWNPAEIIGDHPNLLDYSLYDFLIMKKIWHQGRKIIGYQNIEPYPLMVKFGNKPYVDLRGSFNSLIPNTVNALQKKKLINFYLKKLNTERHLHDKVEFEILFSCYDLVIDKRLKELKKNNFTNKEIQELKNALIIFTNKIISSFPKIQENCEKSINQLSTNRKSILANLNSKTNYKDSLTSAEKLLKNCREFGTLPFSTMARISFISSILLKSLENEKQIPQNFIENFMKSISTPLSEIQNDADLLAKNKISKNQFLSKYGHLRPGTYDITASRYDEEKDFFDNIKFLRKNKISKVIINKNKLSKIFLKHGLKFTNIDFLDFVEQSITQREKLKFEFTKNLSEAIELIANAGNKLGFSRSDMSHLSISSIFSYKKYTKNILKQKWQKQILSETKKYNLAKSLILPPILSSEEDFDFIQYFISKPNFITSKKITGELIFLKHFEQKRSDLENKIVVIENADPGYDWIFTKIPLGLITKYGGVASHMSIRCAEMGLPAAIGCGEILFEQLIDSSKVLLDAKNKQLIIQEHKHRNEHIEERKVLKSLGYIK
jgi:glutamine kinase